ncbi:MAG TPA: glycosyltransferase family 9 protein [Vicinamibacterales bacterium]
MPSYRLRFAWLTGRSLMWEAAKPQRRLDDLISRLGVSGGRLAVFHQGGIGSGIMMGPLLQVLRRQWPRASIDLLSQQPQDGDVLKSVGLIDRRHVVSAVRGYDGGRFDAVLSASRTYHGDRIVRSLPATVKIGFRHRVGWHASSRLFHDEAVTIDSSLHECEQDVRLIEPLLGVGPMPAAPPTLFGLTASRKTHSKPRIFVHAGSSAGMSWKRWSPEKFAQVILQLRERIDADVTMVSGPDERECAAEIIGLLPQAVDLFAPDSIVALFEALRDVDCAISNDGAFMHLACAAGANAVAIFGGTDPAFCGPWAEPRHVRVVRADLSCSPCYQPYSGALHCTNPNRLQCLSDVTPALVMNAVGELLGSSIAA